MASTYVNNLRLEEIATGEQSGTWGNTTNTNLEIIGQATAWGTRAIANASTDTITIADGALDADRSLVLKLTGGGQACTVTLLPNTSSKTWVMYNTTSATLTFTCGSGANVAVPAGESKIIATDGLGSGGVVHDVLTGVNLAGTTKVDDLVVGDDATVTDDLIVGGDIDLEGSIDVNGTANLDVVDIDGAVQLDATLTVGANDQGYDVILYGDTAARNATWDSSADSLEFADNTKETFGTGNDMQLYHDGTNSYITNSQGALKVATETSGIALTIGHSTSEVTFGDNVTVTGDFTVNGTTTTIDTTNLTVTDPLVKFGQGYTGTAYDQGFIVTRGNGSATNTANRGFIWDETADEFVAIACNTEDGTTAGNVTIDSYVNMRVAKLTGSSLDISGDVDVDGTLEADAITLNGTALGSLYSPIAGSSSIVTTGALNSGSITSGFGSINNGASTITTTGALGAGATTVGGAFNVSNATDFGSFTSSIASPILVLNNTNSDSANVYLDFRNNGTTKSRIQKTTDHKLVFSTGGTSTALTLDASQNATFAGEVNVGTTASGDGTLNIIASTGEQSIIEFSDTTNSRGRIYYDHASSPEKLILETTGTTALSIDNSQDATFAGQLQYVGASAGLYGTSSGTADNTIRLDTGSTQTYIGSNGSAGNRFSGSSAYFTTLGTSSAYGLELATNNTVRMSINSAGNATFAGNVSVGDGTITPNGSIDDIAITSANSAAGLTIGTANNGVGYISMADPDSNNGAMIAYNHSTNLWSHIVGGVAEFTLNATTATFAGDIAQTKSAASITQTSTSYVSNFMTAATANWAYTRMTSGSTFYDLAVNTGDASGAFQIRPAGSATNAFTISTAGDVTVNGGVTATGNITAYSDKRVKTNFEVIPNALEKVSKLSGYTFDRTDLEKDKDGNDISVPKQTGVIAQEVLDVLPEVVSKNDDGIYSVAYGNMVGLLIEAIKELKAEVEELKGNK